jgi:hypothetical protein
VTTNRSNDCREPFWRQPRWLVETVKRGHLSLFEFTLLCILAARGLGHRVAIERWSPRTPGKRVGEPEDQGGSSRSIRSR